MFLQTSTVVGENYGTEKSATLSNRVTVKNYPKNLWIGLNSFNMSFQMLQDVKT